MTNKDTILQELQQLNSSLGNTAYQNTTYQVPAGYFEGLAAEILKRIKALESTTAKEELSHLSPLLSSIKKEMLFTIPDGYFDSLEKNLHQTISTKIDQAPQEELAELSSLLSELKKKTTYTIPEGYFENLQPVIDNKVYEPAAKVIPITRRKWFQYAAAAVVIGFVATLALLLKDNRDIDPGTKSYAWIQKNLKKVSTDDINEFVELASTETADVVKVEAKDDISNLVKDISDKEIQDFLNDTQSAEAGTDDDIILN
jgi:hypothetical protein